MPAVEGKGLERDWISRKPSTCDCRQHKGCSLEICINDDGHAKTFKTVCEGLQYLAGKKDRQLIAVGLGKCKSLYGGEYVQELNSLSFVHRYPSLSQ